MNEDRLADAIEHLAAELETRRNEPPAKYPAKSPLRLIIAVIFFAYVVWLITEYVDKTAARITAGGDNETPAPRRPRGGSAS